MQEMRVQRYVDMLLNVICKVNFSFDSLLGFRNQDVDNFFFLVLLYFLQIVIFLNYKENICNLRIYLIIFLRIKFFYFKLLLELLKGNWKVCFLCSV